MLQGMGAKLGFYTQPVHLCISGCSSWVPSWLQHKVLIVQWLGRRIVAATTQARLLVRTYMTQGLSGG